jgi:predicted MPP superfamily phosphohydrolase
MDAEKALKGCPKESTTVLLAHQPNAAHTILTSIRRKVDLVLAGHTHAGQLYPLMPMSYFLNKYYHGLYRFKDSQIYVSAGVHFWGPPVKMANLCEIILIRLRTTL